MDKLKIGLYGGTFSPIHNGHLIVAEHVRSMCGLNKVIFIPSNIPPHKEEYINPQYRYNMIGLAIENNPNFYISDVELKRGDVSYTVDTVRSYTNKFDHDVRFIVGMDAFLELKTWYKYEELIRLCKFIVVNRSCDIFEDIKRYNEFLCSFPNELIQYIQYTKFQRIPTMDISSTYIRQKIKLGESVKYLIPDSVLKYIKNNKLYL